MKCQPSPGAPTRRHHHRRHRCHHHFHTSQSIENTTKICLYLVVTIASMGSGRRNFWPSSDLYHPYLQNSGSSSKIMTKVQPLWLSQTSISNSRPNFMIKHQLLFYFPTKAIKAYDIFARAVGLEGPAVTAVVHLLVGEVGQLWRLVH